MYPGLFLRKAIRRAKQVRFRSERVPLEIDPDESARQEPDDGEAEAEKIEVHVHLHRGDGSKKSRSKRERPPVLTGTLFDWQWYRDRIYRRPKTETDSRWSLATKCQGCDSPLPSTARRCPRCAAPRARRRFLPTVIAVLGLASIGVVFGLCAHILGTSVPEHQPPKPLGQWSGEEDLVIVNVPTGPSPFSYTPPPAAGAASSGNGPATR